MPPHSLFSKAAYEFPDAGCQAVDRCAWFSRPDWRESVEVAELAAENRAGAKRADDFIVAHVNDPDIAIYAEQSRAMGRMTLESMAVIAAFTTSNRVPG